MTTVLAVGGVVVWLGGVAVLAVLVPGEIRRIPTLSITADLAPAVVCALMAALIVAWPALPIAAALNKIAERSTR